MAYERHAKHQWLLHELLQPALIAEPGCRKTAIEEPPRLAVDQGPDSELLGETLQLPRGSSTLLKIHEVGLYPALGKEAKSLPGVSTFLYTEDLNFHGAEL